jgi:hypothetical protein
MAKLKCLAKDNSTPPVKSLFKEGYIRVVDNLIGVEQNYYDFLDAEENERPEMLREYAGKDSNNNWVLEHVLPDETKSEVIDNTNCRIFGQKDKKKKGAGKPSRVTIPIPHARPSDPDWTYLHEYAQAIHDYYQGNDESKRNGRKFLFGIMLLTRCR